MSKFVAVLILSVGTAGLVVGRCDVPPPPCNNCFNDGVGAVEDTMPQGSLLLWTCDPGYVMTGDGDMVVWVCGQNDTWLGPDPVCTVSCPDPPIPAHGSIRGRRQHSYLQGTNLSYVCDKAYSSTLKDPSETECGTDGKWTFSGAACAIDCPRGYMKHNNVCFKVFPSEMFVGYSWEDALKSCKNEEGNLALSKDNVTSTFLKNMMNNDNYWIGAKTGRNWKWASDLKFSNVVQISDDSYVQRLFWDKGEPRGRFGSCVELNGKSDKTEFSWNANDCNNKRGFICQADGSCPAGDTHEHGSFNTTFNNKCYSFIRGNHTWSESRTACESRNNGSLVEILDLSTQHVLSSIASLGESNCWWIGAFEDTNDSSISWFWVDNSRVTTSQWAEGKQSSTSAFCLEMLENREFQWHAGSCAKFRGYFCQRGQVACGDPGAPAHGVRTPDNTSSFQDGATVHFRCDPGYQLNGSASTTCLTNGSWNVATPVCQAVTCIGDPQNVDDANFIVSSRKFRSVVTYTCLEGFLPTAVPVSYCLADATWSRPNFSCSAIGTLPRSTTAFLPMTVGKSLPTLSKAEFLTSTLSTTVEDETTSPSQSRPLVPGKHSYKVIAGACATVAGVILFLISAACVKCLVRKRRNRKEVESDAKQHVLDGKVGYDHTSGSITNLIAISDTTGGQTNQAPSSHSAGVYCHGNYGDRETSMINNPPYSRVTKISTDVSLEAQKDLMVDNPLYGRVNAISSTDNLRDRENSMVNNPLYIAANEIPSIGHLEKRADPVVPDPLYSTVCRKDWEITENMT
ncbi:CUB and sushi domain-containing protein 3-like isoform X3 [Diadema antillarum]|uniref:CUB and sushi domain-containing protein 3-like isoform X3 n=1 Tax=Diadema antillarum TaxID=105358 RepID=UPI003A83A0E2